MKKLLLIALLLSGCSSSNDAIKALKANGFNDIQTHGYAFFGCGQGDTFSTKFTAKNHNGQKVTGVVCSDWLKGSTIRFD